MVLFLLLSSHPVSAQVVQPADSYKAGLQNLKAGNYQAAYQQFSEVLAQNPNNAGAWVGRGNCNYYLKRYQEALDDFQKAQALQPSPQLDQFVQFLRSKLAVPPPLPPQGPASTNPQAKTGKANNEGLGPGIGARFYSEYLGLNLSDFQTSAKTGDAMAKQAWLSDTSTKYAATWPVSGANVVLEPTYRFDSHFEVGLPLTGFYTDSYAVSQYSNSQGPDAATFQLSALSAGLNARYILGGGEFALEFSGGPRVVPISLQYNGVSSSVTASGNFSIIALGAEAQMGIDWQPFTGIVIGPKIGYQLVSGSGFHGTISGSGISSVTGTFMMVNTSQGSSLTLIPDGNTPPSGSRPLAVDLSGLVYGAQLSAYF